MKLVNKDFVIYQGATFKQKFRLVSKKSPCDSIDISGYTFLMHGKVRKNDVEPVFELSTENGAIRIIEAERGIFEVVWPTEVTQPIQANTCVYDLLAISPLGDVKPLFGGRIGFIKGVTQLPVETTVEPDEEIEDDEIEIHG